MALTNLLRLPVTLGHRSDGGVDEYGEPVEDVVITTTVGHIAQVTTSEDGEGIVVTERLQLILPPNLPVPPQPWDYAEVMGRRYEVDGQPFPVTNPRTGRLSHYMLYLKRGE